jgi:hypothetical protein
LKAFASKQSVVSTAAAHSAMSRASMKLDLPSPATVQALAHWAEQNMDAVLAAQEAYDAAAAAQ